MAMFLGAMCSIELFTPIKVPAVYATSAKIENILALTPTATPTPSPTPYYSMETLIQSRGISGSQREYADYIWDKWAPHGNRAQAVALCTNMAEGHLDDASFNINTDGSTDKGCWQWNSIHSLSDSLTMNCNEATDYTYAVWKKRVSLGIPDGFSGMWYGYGSNNYNLCMEMLTQ